MEITRRRLLVAGSTSVAATAAIPSTAWARAAHEPEAAPEEESCAVVESVQDDQVTVAHGDGTPAPAPVPLADFPEGLAPESGEQVVLDPASARGEVPAADEGAAPLVDVLEVPSGTDVSVGVKQVPLGRFEIVPETIIQPDGDGRRLAFVTRGDGEDFTPRALAIVYRP